MSTFDFASQPLDVALRVFLMSASLPPETQQIDRCVEAFAKRYHDCNPGLFDSSDKPYVLAFSLVMLSTDAFNAANKHKMTKTDYVKNLRDQGVPEAVLEVSLATAIFQLPVHTLTSHGTKYFYDQISLTPFVFVEDDDDPSRLEQLPSPGVLSRPGSSSMRDKGKLDVYSMIVKGQVYSLRIDIEHLVPSKSPFSFTGTTSFFVSAFLRIAGGDNAHDHV